MARFIIRRVLWAIPVLFISSVIVFVTIRATTNPIAAAARNPHTTPAALAKYKHDIGFDKSEPQQYWIWLTHFLRGDFGSSLHSQGLAVWPLLRTALVNSLVLGLIATALAIFIGVIIGIISAIKQYSAFDHGATGLAFFGLSLPTFWFCLILIVLFGVFYESHTGHSSPLLPSSGIYSPGSVGFHLGDRAKHLILPILALMVQIVAVYSRYMRTSMLEVINSDYMRTARSKGISEKRVIIRHAVRNALIPIATFTALDVGAIASGLIVTEQLFQYPGMGVYFLNAWSNGDYPLILPWVMITVMFVIICNLLADISYAVLDPRIRLD